MVFIFTGLNPIIALKLAKSWQLTNTNQPTTFLRPVTTGLPYVFAFTVKNKSYARFNKSIAAIRIFDLKLTVPLSSLKKTKIEL